MSLPIFGGIDWDEILGKKPRSRGQTQERLPAPEPVTSNPALPASQSPWQVAGGAPHPTEPPKTSGMDALRGAFDPPKVEVKPNPPLTWKNAADQLGPQVPQYQAAGNVAPKAPEMEVTPVTPDPGPMVMARAPMTPQVEVKEAPTNQNLAPFKQDPLTEAGRLYEDYVTTGLRDGKFGELDAARGAYDRNSALRNTSATEAAKQQALRAGAAPGSALFQSIFNQATGGANRANLEEQNGVNALGRQLMQQAMDRAAGIEDRTYKIAEGERALKYGRADLAEERKKAADAVAKGDQTSFLNSIEDGAVRSWAASQFAQGKPLAEVAAGIWSTDPTTGRTVYRPEIASLSPGQQNAKNINDLLTNLGIDPSKIPAIKEGIAGNITAPITSGTKEANIQAIMEKVRSGAKLEPAELDALKASTQIPQIAPAAIPKGAGNVRSWLTANPNQLANINGKVFKVLEGGSFHNGNNNFWGSKLDDDWVSIQDVETGKVYYYSDASDVKPEDRWFSEKPTNRNSAKGPAAF